MKSKNQTNVPNKSLITRNFNNLSDSSRELQEILKKLTFNEVLDTHDQSYVLSIALIFITEYEKDKKYTTYFEFAYYLILKFSLIHESYQPLYDLSINYGFYPIAKKIVDLNFLERENIIDIIHKEIINHKFTNGYTKTLHQYDSQEHILKSIEKHISYSAPTSFGKSEIIFAHLEQLLSRSKRIKVGIITPTRSLLTQTHTQLKKIALNHSMKIIQHDEMLQEDDQQYLAVLTQERALRILEKENQYFDVLYIDKAHNLFEKDNRSILLSRVIRLNKQKNPQQQILYFSPIIQNADSLTLDDIQECIKEVKININLKELDIFEYNQELKTTYKHNRFLDFANLNWEYGQNHSDFMEYILANLRNKNFFFLNRPVKIEKFARDLSEQLPELVLNSEEEKQLKHLLQNVSDSTHINFYPIEFLKKGIVYLHAKMPAFIKEYLEYCYQKYDFLKFLIANTVILQGITLPIDNLFILNTKNINSKPDLLNLAGRVNRLNYVFSQNNLQQLFCPIHFVDSAGKYSRDKGNMRNQIQLLKSNIFQDELNNPLLKNYNELSKDATENALIREREKSVLIQTNKELLSEDNIKKILIENNIYSLINLEPTFISQIITNARQMELDGFKNGPIQTLYNIFFSGLNTNLLTKNGKVLERFINEHSSKATINFYEIFLKQRWEMNYKARITSMFNYLQDQKSMGNNFFYMTTSYGEIDKFGGYHTAYIDLSQKTDIELINFSIVKLKIEDDFIDFELNNFLQVLYKLRIISDNEYNLITYGTNDEKMIELIKVGLTAEIRILLKDHKLLDDFYVNQLGLLAINTPKKDAFKKFISSINELQRYSFQRIISDYEF